MDTIVALSSGRPPAAIGVVRVSGPAAVACCTALVGRLPPPRQASLRVARDAAGGDIDRLLLLVFPGPASATGEDLVELHCHGARATIDAIVAALVSQPGVRVAEPGEFTRRALGNGRIDLAQAEGLADLLQAETQAQRRLALAAAEGQVSGLVRGWLARLADISAAVEAVLDFADEDDVAHDDRLLRQARAAAVLLRIDIEAVLAVPPIERVRDGLRVVIAGPPNAGKSTLLNLLSRSDAAIVSAVAGTTRDRVEVPVRRGDIAYRLTDTAGLTDTADTVERIGVERATAAIREADLLLWLGDDTPPRGDALWVHTRGDVAGRGTIPAGPHLAIRSDRSESIDALWEEVDRRAATLLPHDEVALNLHQLGACTIAATELALSDDPVLAGEQLRLARRALAGVLGIDATDVMLDALFGRFCLGK